MERRTIFATYFQTFSCSFTSFIKFYKKINETCTIFSRTFKIPVLICPYEKKTYPFIHIFNISVKLYHSQTFTLWTIFKRCCCVFKHFQILCTFPHFFIPFTKYTYQKTYAFLENLLSFCICLQSFN